MKKDDIFLLLLAILLLLGMLLTFLLGGEESKHGYGAVLQKNYFLTQVKDALLLS